MHGGAYPAGAPTRRPLPRRHAAEVPEHDRDGDGVTRLFPAVFAVYHVEEENTVVGAVFPRGPGLMRALRAHASRPPADVLLAAPAGRTVTTGSAAERRQGRGKDKAGPSGAKD